MPGEALVDLELLPEGVDEAESLGVEVAVGEAVILLGEVVEVRVQDLHGLLAHVLGVLLGLIHHPVGAAVHDILGVGDGGLLLQHVVDEGLGQLLLLTAGGDARGVSGGLSQWR